MARSRLLSLLALAAAATPFAFGMIRAVTTGNDVRYIWVALASGAATAAVMTTRKRAAGKLRGALTISAAVFVIATAAAALAARLLGTAVGPGMLVVATAFGLCFAFAACLRAMARSPIC